MNVKLPNPVSGKYRENYARIFQDDSPDLLICDDCGCQTSVVLQRNARNYCVECLDERERDE